MKTDGSEGEAIEAGAIVVDRDQDEDEQNPAVVMNTPPVPAKEWEVRALDQTVAESNPDYPEDSEVAIVLFQSWLEDDRTDVPDEVRSKLAAHEPVSVADAGTIGKIYAFPKPRLEATGEYWPDEDVDVSENEESIDLNRLATVMRKAGFDDVEQRDEHVQATKLGETYRVNRSGEIVEGGALVDKLASFVEQQYIESEDKEN